jgi:hypothetical protein
MMAKNKKEADEHTAAFNAGFAAALADISDPAPQDGTPQPPNWSDPKIWHTNSDRPELEVVWAESLVKAEGRKQLIEGLKRDGAVIFRPHSVSVTITEMMHTSSASRAFFSKGMQTKEDSMSKQGPHQGYVNRLAEKVGCECFEAKVHRDREYKWPEPYFKGDGPSKPATFRLAQLRMLRFLVGCAKQAVIALTLEMPMEYKHLVMEAMDMNYGDAMEDNEEYNGVVLVDKKMDWETCSQSGLTTWLHQMGRPSEWMTDSGLITVGPAGSDPGFRLRSPVDGREWFPEEQMRKNNGDLLLYCGEAMNYLTGGQIPAAKFQFVPHKTDIQPGMTRPPLPRIAFQFKLKPPRGLMLRTPDMPELSVKDLEENKDDLILSWPWKKDNPYYTDPKNGKYTFPEKKLLMFAKPAGGLKWRRIGNSVGLPDIPIGVELIIGETPGAEALDKAIRAKHSVRPEFTEEEFAALGIEGLRADHYINCGDFFWAPDERAKPTRTKLKGGFFK